MDYNTRWNALVEMATPNDPPTSLSIDKYLQVLQELFQLGASYAAEGDEENAFVLFLKFISMAVEELPNHDVYPRISIAERLSIDAKIIEAMATAEYLKVNLRKRYERECFEKNSNPSLTVPKKSNIPSSEWNNFEGQLGPYILCHEVSVQPIVFQQVVIPNDLPQMFLKHATGDFRFAYLYGRLVRNSIVASHLIIATIEEINTKRFDRFVNETDTENDLPIIGCVCTSLAEVCKTSFFRRFHLSEMVCVICPQGPDSFNKNYILHLMNMSPSTSFHQKTNANREAGGTGGCRHLQIIDGLSTVVVNPDVNNTSPTSAASTANSAANSSNTISTSNHN